jgi:hypothetical protein
VSRRVVVEVDRLLVPHDGFHVVDRIIKRLIETGLGGGLVGEVEADDTSVVQVRVTSGVVRTGLGLGGRPVPVHDLGIELNRLELQPARDEVLVPLPKVLAGDVPFAAPAVTYEAAVAYSARDISTFFTKSAPSPSNDSDRSRFAAVIPTARNAAAAPAPSATMKAARTQEGMT